MLQRVAAVLSCRDLLWQQPVFHFDSPPVLLVSRSQTRSNGGGSTKQHGQRFLLRHKGQLVDVSEMLMKQKQICPDSCRQVNKVYEAEKKQG